MTARYRADALAGIDPRKKKQAAAGTTEKPTFAQVVDQFIEHHAKPRQRTWHQTERVLKRNCAAWLDRPFDSITKQDARALLRGYVAEGHGPKAQVTRAWLKKLWRWAVEEDLIDVPIMEQISLNFERVVRDRFYTDDEIKAIWAAADMCRPDEAAFTKLLCLLAPRKTSLACLRPCDLDDPTNPTLWTVPFELTKSKKIAQKKRVYLVPLPKLAQRILRGLTMPADATALIFSGLNIYPNPAGGMGLNDNSMKTRLKQHGAPSDYKAHDWRRTIATHFENKGRSEWERGILLNHAGTGVTAMYSHGYPLDLKRQLLEEWANHVEALVTPKGAKRLR
jgi:integrase